MRNVKVNSIKMLVAGIFSASASIALAQSNPPFYAGCTDSQFVVGTLNNQINTSGANYTPKCLKVRKGASVTITATDRHPLAAAPTINNVINPFASGAPFTSPQIRIMDTAGAFGYYCNVHGDSEGDGMAGLIIVED